MVTPWKLPGRIGGRSRIDGAVPARKVEGQDTTPGPVSVDQDFAGEEPEAVEEDLAGGESAPSAEDSPDGLAEQGTTRGLEHQVKIDQFQAFISRLSLEKSSESWICKNCTLARRKLSHDDALKTKCCRTVQRGPSIRCTARENLVPLGAKTPLSMLHRPIFQMGSCGISCPPLAREEQAAGEMQERAISPAAAQDKAAAASARFAQVFPHVHVTQLRPTFPRCTTKACQEDSRDPFVPACSEFYAQCSLGLS